MLLLGIDLGTSAVKISIVDSSSRSVIATSKYPDEEAPVYSPFPGWAEQNPELWWDYFVAAFKLCRAKGKFNPRDISAIGIAYQMHGLVVINKKNEVLRNAIIWSDSRAVGIGEESLKYLGRSYCHNNLLNSPGNFTASKLAWVKNNEPHIFDQIDKIMLPGDFLGLKLCAETSTTLTGLSEAILYDFKLNQLSKEVIECFGFDTSLIPTAKESFSIHGFLLDSVAKELGLKAGIPISYKAGDQPNNALSLNVLEPGEVAATAGTSGVIYAVTDKLIADRASRVNTFAHVNHQGNRPRLGVLLCINGAGSMNRWIRELAGRSLSYPQINSLAAELPFGSEGVQVHPFGNGAERMLENRILGARISGLDVNIHNQSHIFRATQEGIAASFRFGLDIMRENGMKPTVIRAGNSNMFLSDVFSQAFVNLTQIPVELYANDSSAGAALGAGIGAGIYKSSAEATRGMRIIKTFEPQGNAEAHYQIWKEQLQMLISQSN